MDRDELEGFIEFENKEEEEKYFREIGQQNTLFESESDSDERNGTSGSNRKRRKKRSARQKKLTKKQAILLHALKHLPELEEMFIENDKDILMSTCSEEELLHHWVHLHKEWCGRVFAPHLNFENAVYFMEQQSMSHFSKRFLNNAREKKLNAKEPKRRNQQQEEERQEEEQQ